MKRAVPSLIFGLAGVAVFTYSLIHVMKIGTCASGNTPFVIAHQCPSGTGGWILLLSGGIIVSVIAMIAGGMGTGLLVWSALFLVSGVAMLINSLTAHALSAGANSAGYIVGGVFIPMGAVPLLFLLKNGLGGLSERRLRARSKEADATVSRVEELQHYGLHQAKIRVSYALQPNDDVSFEVTRETNVLAMQMPRVGQRVKIRYDPGNHAKWELVTLSPAEVAAALSSLRQTGAPGI